MRLYAITDRLLSPGTPAEQAATLLRQAQAWVQGGVEYIQLREKDLPGEELADLARRLAAQVARHAEAGGLRRPRILLNAADLGQIALARRIGLDGVHLPGAFAASAAEVREAWLSGQPASGGPVISRACHALEEVEKARHAGIALVLFAPVFEKPLWNRYPPGELGLAATLPGAGLIALQAACRAAKGVPVFALGGVTVDNARACLDAGAAGVAAVRLFAGDRWRALSD